MKKNKINYKKYNVKPFPHFDQRIPITNNVKKNLQNPYYIARHSFYPFIHYKIVTRKFHKEKGLSDPKIREIYYASHMDGYIFKYYGDLLNYYYNKVCIEKGIDEVSIAYRNNKGGKSNIHFAAEVIEFITNQDSAFIFVSDFSKYFDSLDHEILKEKLKATLRKTRLDNDWWNVFKHITRFSWVEKADIEKDLDIKKGKSAQKEENQNRYYSPSEFRGFRKRVKIKKSNSGIGIPQGTAISAVLANIYAIDFDQALNIYAISNGGIYRRYSDDIILVIPIKDAEMNKFIKHIAFIKKTVEERNNG
jgi:hypothetical protein